MNEVYFINYKNTIKFFQGNKTFEIVKTPQNLAELCKLENKFIFKNLLTK